jgi:hypothetical protein
MAQDALVLVERSLAMKFVHNDGGRRAAGFKGNAGDCVPRAIAIATGRSYRQVYDELTQCNAAFVQGRSRAAKRLKARGNTTPRNGVFKSVYRPYLESLGWEFVATMGLGTGCQVHLRSEELPKGRIIVRLSRHLATVIDGVLHDTYDCSRAGTRCVYGYYRKRHDPHV